MPQLTIIVSAAMADAVKLHAEAKNCSVADVVVAALRLAGFEREDVLEKLAKGEPVDIDVRRRQPASERPAVERVQEYLAGHGCATLMTIYRNLHMSTEDAKRGVMALLNNGTAHQKPFDRPVIIHWTATCTCPVALCANLPRRQK